MSNNLASAPWRIKAYQFPQFLMLTNNAAVESILAEIPFFAVGLLGFGVFTFFILMRRVSLPTLYLYASIITAFIASILDLSQILAQGSHNYNPNEGMSPQNVSPLIVVREIGFSVSVGLRFLFLWMFVAECPRGERVSKTINGPRGNVDAFATHDELHCASWSRLGVSGIILKWSLLTIVVTIVVLQLIWRIVKDLNMYGPVYVADATFQIATSTLFILKLILNIFLSSVTPRWLTFRYYSAPVVAIMISAGVGIGNLACFAFSESILGRFLQAVELYILIVFVLVSTFYGLRTSDSISTRMGRRISSESFAGLPKARRETPNSLLSHPSVGQPGNISPSRASTVSRVSTWINNRRVSRRRLVNGDQTRLWSRDEAERGLAFVGEKSGSPRASLDSIGSLEAMEQKEPQVLEEPVYGPSLKNPTAGLRTLFPPSIRPLTSAFSVDSQDEGPLPSLPNSVVYTLTRKPPPNLRQPSNAFSLASYYTDSKIAREQSQLTNSSMIPRGTDSPVYGLDGIIRTQNGDRGQRRLTARRSTVSSLDELFRQQKELDRSIAALRLFSPAGSSVSFPPERAPSRNPIPIRTSVGNKNRRSDASSVKVDTGSPHSEFSLSYFPTPPRANTPPLPETAPIIINRVRLGVRSRIRPAFGSRELVPPRMPAAADDVPEPRSLPGTPRGSHDIVQARKESRFDSSGTQYDVTSFIGDLTTPRTVPRKDTAFERLPDIESEDGSIQIETPTIVTVHPSSAARPVFVDIDRLPPYTGASNASLVTMPPATASSGLITEQEPSGPEGVRDMDQDLKYASENPQAPTPPWDMPLIRRERQNVLPSASLNASVPPASSRVALGPRLGGRQQPGLPARPRLAISGPRPPPQDGKNEQAPGAFERPRPPPLFVDQQPTTQEGMQQGLLGPAAPF